MRRFGWILAGLIALMAVTAPVYAATPTVVAVDINSANFSWTFTQGTGGMPNEWWFECGPTTGTYTMPVVKATDATGVLRTFPVKNVVTVGGPYYCALRASNQYGQSPRSPEVAFNAGTAPTGTPALTLTFTPPAP